MPDDNQSPFAEDEKELERLTGELKQSLATFRHVANRHEEKEDRGKEDPEAILKALQDA